jgi:alpha-tubulin suppressor-like RCC1 family protein
MKTELNRRRIYYALVVGAVMLLSGPARAEVSGESWRLPELVSAGRSSFTCALRTDGAAICWGLDDSGQASPPAETFVQVSTGRQHACGVREDGTAICWGDDRFGKLDAPASAFRQITVGGDHTCGLRTDGGISCWGSGTFGQLDAPAGEFVQVGAGADHNCAVRSDGNAVCWGRNSVSGQLTPPPVTFTQVSAGTYHSCGIGGHGAVRCWGSNTFGEGSAPAGEFIQVNAGEAHTCGVRRDGVAVCWGANSFGQSNAPAGEFEEVSAGVNHTCGARTEGTVACWGNDTFGQSTPPEMTAGERQLSAGADHACEVRPGGGVGCWGEDSSGRSTPPGETFRQVASSRQHSCGVRADGSVECWGDDTYGQASPPADGTFMQVSTGVFHSCALRSDGSVACWGENIDGDPLLAPDGPFRQVSVGLSYACGVHTEGGVECWGYAGDGQLDPLPGTFAQVSAGTSHACGVRSAGSLGCWGRNTFGELDAPAGTFRQVSTGVAHACAVRSDGSVACWGGNNYYGELDAPPEVFRQVSAGRVSSCGVRADNRVVCWGANASGQAPRPELAPSSLPGGVLAVPYEQSLTLAAEYYAFVVPEFSLTAGGVPGLNLSDEGVLGGAPTATGSFPLTVVGEDANGFAASRAYTVAIISDTTPPVVTPTVEGTSGNDGWFTSDVSVDWTVVDDESTVSVQIGCDAKSVTTDTAGKTFTCQATSSGGTTTESVTIQRDASAPVLIPSVSPNPVPVDGVATASPGASDATSGIVSAACAAVVTTSAGSFNVPCTAEDAAGNAAVAQASYVVQTEEPASSIRFLAPLAGRAYHVGGRFRAKLRIVDATGKPIPDAEAKKLVAACRVKVGLDEATSCARYNDDKDLFRFMLTVRRGTSRGPHPVVAQVLAADRTVAASAQRTIIVR